MGIRDTAGAFRLAAAGVTAVVCRLSQLSLFFYGSSCHIFLLSNSTANVLWSNCQLKSVVLRSSWPSNFTSSTSKYPLFLQQKMSQLSSDSSSLSAVDCHSGHSFACCYQSSFHRWSLSTNTAVAFRLAVSASHSFSVDLYSCLFFLSNQLLPQRKSLRCSLLILT